MWINRLVRLVLPRQERFFTHLEHLSERMTVVAALFGELADCSCNQQFDVLSARLKPLETEADLVCQRVFEELDRTFVTPIDREDLARLTRTLDDVIDGMEHSAAFAALYRFDRLSGPMRLLVGITTQAVGQLSLSIAKLRKFSEPGSINTFALAMHTLENEADVIHRAAIKELFAGEMDTREVIRQKDMLFSLETGIDRCEDAMDVIRSVVVKNG